MKELILIGLLTIHTTDDYKGFNIIEIETWDDLYSLFGITWNNSRIYINILFRTIKIKR